MLACLVRVQSVAHKNVQHSGDCLPPTNDFTDAIHSQNVLGEINSDGDNVHEFPLHGLDGYDTFYFGIFDVVRGNLATTLGRRSLF